jgi:hypothetical protein
MRERRTRNGRKALMATPHGGKGEAKTKAQEAEMAERKGKKPPSPPPLRFISRGRALRSGCPARINCRESSLHADERAPPRPQRPHHRGRAIITAKTSRDRGKRSHPPATPPTKRARARPRRLRRRARVAKPQPRLRGILGPGPLPSKENPRAGRTPGSRRSQPSKGHRREKVAWGLLEVKHVPRAPMPRKTLERHEPLARDEVSPRRDIGMRKLPGACLK